MSRKVFRLRENDRNPVVFTADREMNDTDWACVRQIVGSLTSDNSNADVVALLSREGFNIKIEEMEMVLQEIAKARQKL